MALATTIVPLVTALVVVMAGGSPALADSTQLDSFHFLEPLVPSSGDPDQFDAGLLDYLKVEVCEVTSTGCPSVKVFTSESSLSERIRISQQGQWIYYAVNWDTKKTNLGNLTYRVQVSVAGLLLGSIDLAPDAYKTFPRTWPIKFLIERDPAIWIHLLATGGDSLWEVADFLRSELGVCDDQLAEALLSGFPGATAEEVGMVVSNVCQDAVVPETTKVADRATREALASFDPDSGQMVFLTFTSQLKDLEVGDVLVSKPGPAAPYGYLRRVTSITKVQGQAVLETVQALLTEAISEGDLDVAGVLLPSNPVAATAATATSTAGAFGDLRGMDQAVALAAIDEGDGFTFQQDIDVTIEFDESDEDVEGTGTVRVQGSVYFNAGYNVGLGIEGCLAITLVCVDRFEAWAGGEQKSVLRVTGDFDGTLKKEQLIAPIPMSPIVFFIGPVPVVIVPRLDVLLGVEGNAHVDFVLDAKGESRIRVGAKWTDPDDGGIGWENISEFTPLSGELFDFDYTADFSLEAYGKVNGSLLLYNVAGPGMDASVGIEGSVQTGRRPYWQVRGHGVTNVNFSISLILPVAQWNQSVLNEHFLIEESSDSPPVFTNLRDGAMEARVGNNVYIGPTRFGDPQTYDVFDPEGDTFTLSATTSDGTTVNWPNVNFASPGLKTVTITAQANGLTSTHQLGINVRNDPPTVTITPASGTVPATVQYWLIATAYDPEEGDLECSRITWSATGTYTKYESGSARSCTAMFKFSTPGDYVVTATAVDDLGAPFSQTHDVTVTAAPESPYPEIEPGSFSVQALSRINRTAEGVPPTICLKGTYCEVENGDYIFNGYGGDFISPLILSVNVSEGARVQWYCQTGANLATITDNGDGTHSCTPIYSPTEPIKVYATVSWPPSGIGEGPGPTVVSEERTYFMLQAPS